MQLQNQGNRVPIFAEPWASDLVNFQLFKTTKSELANAPKSVLESS